MRPMRLATRLTIFFLAALLAVLAGFSLALHLTVARDLRRRLDERLESGLDQLAAAAEVGPEGVEWEPEERSLALRAGSGIGRFAWRVGGPGGVAVDGAGPAEIVAALAGPSLRNNSGEARDAAGGRWRIRTRRLDRQGDPGRPGPLEPGRYASLELGTAVAADEADATIRSLDLNLIALSVAVELVALIAARRLCRAALRPLRAMADAAAEIGGDEPGRRLPAAAADDELGALGRSFNGLLDRLGEALGRQQRFTGEASHQLRTPLTVIQGQVDLALRQDRPPDEYRRVLGLVQARTRHLRQIVDGLLFLARADAEARRPDLERVELVGWVEDFFEGWADPRRADVRLDADGARGAAVRIHRPLFGELVGNLLDNAARYGTGGTAILVRVERRPGPPGEVRLAITNFGPMIDPADLARVFDPFYRTESARLRGSTGLGLGLAIAARVAAAVGGRIEAESTPEADGTTTFAVILPACEP